MDQRGGQLKLCSLTQNELRRDEEEVEPNNYTELDNDWLSQYGDAEETKEREKNVISSKILLLYAFQSSQRLDQKEESNSNE